MRAFGWCFVSAPRINRVLGKSGAKTVSKIVHLLLAAIAVMIIRRSLTMIATGKA
jgi:multiple antibiotic resistance protein